MAAAKKEITLRFLLERYFGKTDVFQNNNKDTRNFFLDVVIQAINEVEEFCETLQKIEEEAHPTARYLGLQQFAKTVVQHVTLTNQWPSLLMSNKKDRDSEYGQVNKEQLKRAFNTVVDRMVDPPEFAKKRRRLN